MSHIRVNKWLMNMVFLALMGIFMAMYKQAYAASFDCARAQTSVENRICSNGDLSKMDENLSELYKQTQKKVIDTQYLKHQESLWLQIRNKCGIDDDCIYKSYMSRIGELKRLLLLTPSINTQESHVFKSESDKLKFIHDVVKWQSFEWVQGAYETDRKFCEQFMNDFLSENNYTAIEPTFTSNDEHDQRFDKYNSCHDKAFPQGANEYSFYYLSMLGGPPYRYYLLESDGRNNGLDEVIYTTYRFKEGTTGYSLVKVDDESCSVYGGASGSKDWMGIPRKYFRLNTLIRYKDAYYAVFLEPTIYAGRGKYRLEISNLFPPPNKVSCERQPSNVN